MHIHIRVPKLLGDVCSNSQKYIVWVKIIIFLLSKIIDIKIMFHEDVLYHKYIKT